MLRTLCALLVLCSSLSACLAGTRELPRPLPYVDPMVRAVSYTPPPVVDLDVDPAPTTTIEAVPAAPAQTVDPYVVTYEWLRALPPDELIRIAWAGTGQADRAISIARRESGLRCDAQNPHSSATGLFQTLSIHRPRAERLGLKWSDVTGPDCLADVILARDMYDDSGWGPWRT